MEKEFIELLIENSKELYNLDSIFINNAFKKCSALTLTLREKRADADRINEAMRVIKRKVGIFSNLRGNNLVTIATAISLENNMEEALEEINNIYKCLKNEFLTTQYLALASIVIFNARERINIEETIKKTRMTYNYMKKNHRFLTGSEDVTAAAMIAVTSDNLEETMKFAEEYYEGLRDKGYWSGNNLQELSHILTLFNGEVNQNINKVYLIDKALRENNIKIRSFSLPLLGIAAVVTEEFDIFARRVKETSDKLKKEKGFGSLSLGSHIRNMMAIGVVAASYIESLDEEEKGKIINTTNNITLTIQIAIEIAAATAAAGAAAAASSSS